MPENGIMRAYQCCKSNFLGRLLFCALPGPTLGLSERQSYHSKGRAESEVGYSVDLQREQERLREVVQPWLIALFSKVGRGCP